MTGYEMPDRYLTGYEMPEKTGGWKMLCTFSSHLNKYQLLKNFQYALCALIRLCQHCHTGLRYNTVF